MRIVSLTLFHETNTFAKHLTTIDDFTIFGDREGKTPASALYAKLKDTGTVHGGFLDRADAVQAALHPLYVAFAMPGGMVEKKAWRTIRDDFLFRLREGLPADGILLDFHGAMVSETTTDPEGELAVAVRHMAGPDMPIVMVVDPHANLSPVTFESVDAVIAYDCYPHSDMRERGREAFQLITDMIRVGVKTSMAFQRVPLLTFPPKQCTLRDPMRAILGDIHRREEAYGVLTVSVAYGFPFADHRAVGMNVFAVTREAPVQAEKIVQAVSRDIFARREEFHVDLTPVEEAVRYAREEARGPVVLADGSDNPGGGAPGDGTVVLQKLLAQNMEHAVVGVIADPETVRHAYAAGIGATVDVRIGGKTDARHGDPVSTTAVVRTLCDGEFTYKGGMLQGMRDSMGRAAVLTVGGVDVVIAEKRTQLLDREMLRAVHITPEEKRFIAVKSAVHFRHDFGRIADRIFDADTPGIHRPDISGFDYRHLQRPLYPLDPAATLTDGWIRRSPMFG